MNINFEGGIKFCVEAETLAKLKPETLNKLGEVIASILTETSQLDIPPTPEAPDALSTINKVLGEG